MKKRDLYRDRNGNRIVEGDVIRFWLISAQKYVCAEAQWDGFNWVFGDYDTADIDFQRCTIIGNIYANWDVVSCES